MTHRLYPLLLALPACLLCGARTIEVTPGSLAAALAEGSSGSDRELTLTGSLDGRDFEALRSLEGIATLDLSQVSLTEYSTLEPLYPDVAYFPANTLTRYSLFGLRADRIILPAGLTAIGEGALAATTASEITIPAGVAAIGDNAFYGASHLRKMELPARLQKLGRRAFASCGSLRSINIEATAVTDLPEGCFAATASLAEADTRRIRRVGREAFAGSGVRTLALPVAVDFAPFALAGMESLERITLNPDAVFSEGLLLNDTRLSDISGVPAAVPGLFAANCTSLSPAGITAEATTIGRYAFANCGATTLVLGRDITVIGSDAFAGCHDLTEIDATSLAGFTPAAEPSAFDGICTPDVTLRVTDGCEDTWRSHPVWGSFNVVGATTGAVAPAGESGSGVTLGISGGSILASSDSGSAITMAVYDTDGRRVAFEKSADGHLSVSLAQLPDGILLVEAHTEAGHTGKIKILN